MHPAAQPYTVGNVLVDYQIREYIKAGLLHRQGEDLDHLVNPASFDVTLGPTILRERSEPGRFTLRTWDDSSSNMYRQHTHDPDEKIFLEPGESILAHTIEFFEMPPTLLGEYYQKSRLARFGLDHKVAGYIDPGFRGNLTLELINANRYTRLALIPGQRIGQVKFTVIQEPREPYAGHYSLLGVSPARALAIGKDPSKISKRL